MSDSEFGRKDFGQGGLNPQVDVDSLLAETGIDRSELTWRKDFIGFDEEDVDRLTSYRDEFEQNAEQIADEFYENLTRYEETVEVIGHSPKTVDQLKRTQSAYLVTLASGEYGMEYFEDRARIGKIHDLLDMPMKQYLGQYGVYYDLLLPLVGDQLTADLVERLSMEHPGDGHAEADLEALVRAEVDEAVADILALLRIINLDMQVAVDSYLHSYNEEVRAEIAQQEEIRAGVEDAVDAANATADNVAESTDEISSLARSQAESMENVAGEVGQMSATIEEIASTAEEVAATSERAETLAEEGREAGVEAIEAMERIDDASADVASDVQTLESRIEEIDEIVEVINDIADQTNMLALNASIEAARAGEAGDGFAVVADEVKSLAEESQSHASEIESMVEEIKGDTAETVESLETTTEQVDRGIDQVEEAMDTLQEIARAVQESSQGIREVSEATDDQAASTEEVASMVDELLEQAEQVADEIDQVAVDNDRQVERVQEISETVQRLG